MAKSDIELAYEAIKAKQPEYDTRFSYYKGEAALRYSTRRLQEAFEDLNVYFSHNVIGLVVSSVLDRLTLKGFSIKDETANNALNQLFLEQDMQLLALDVHEAALVTSESFVVVSRDETGELDIYFNDPRATHMFYRSDKPKVPLFAAKYWQDEQSERKYIALFYADRTETWSASKNTSTARGFSLESTEVNESGIIPVFHFRGDAEFGLSEISEQDAINKIFSDMMVASEFTSVRQRVIISKADPGDLRTFENWWIPDEEAKVQEIGGGDLKAFTDPMDNTLSKLAVATKTPKYFLYTQADVPSGEALLAMEAPFVKKCKQRQESYAVTWTRLCVYLLGLMGITVKDSDITPTWEPVETSLPLTRAQILQTEVSAGVPLEVSAKRQGWAEDEIQQLQESDSPDANPTGVTPGK